MKPASLMRRPVATLLAMVALAMGVATVLDTVLDTAFVTTVQAAVAAAARCPAPVRILPLGDSLTYGLLPNPASEDSYRGHLFRSLTQLGYSIDLVGPNHSPLGLGGDPDHAGFGGYTIGPDRSVDYRGTPANLGKLVGEWVPALNPDVIILDIGANDLAAGDQPVSDLAAEAADPNGRVLANLAPLRLQGLVNLLLRLAPNAIIIVGDTPPAGASAAADSSASKAALRAMAKQLGETSDQDRVLYAPVYQRLLDAGFDRTRDLVDGTHMTAAGGAMFAAALQPTVLPILDRLCAASPSTPVTPSTTKKPVTPVTPTTVRSPTSKPAGSSARTTKRRVLRPTTKKR